MSIKHMDVADFRARGYLQEVNRRVLHPLGLALEVTIDDETGAEHISGVWDYQDDPEGILFDGDLADLESKYLAVEREWESREAARVEALGYMIQPAVEG